MEIVRVLDQKIAWVVADETTGSKVAERLVREWITWVSAEGPTESRAGTELDTWTCNNAALQQSKERHEKDYQISRCR